jgi:hypothetical protein
VETLEQYQERVRSPIRLTDLLGKRVHIPFPSDSNWRYHPLDIERAPAEVPDHVAVKDLGCLRSSTYRDLGRGATVNLDGDRTGTTGRKRPINTPGSDVDRI